MRSARGDQLAVQDAAPQQALDAPRVFALDGRVEVERGISQAVVDALAAKGDTAGARSAYREALNKTPADAPNRSYLQIKLDALGGES